MKSVIFLKFLLYLSVSVSQAQIIIKGTRTPSISTNRPGIIVPGPDGGVIAVQQPQIIELLDGDTLKGTFVDYDSETGAKWRHSAAKDDIEFLADSLSKIQLFPRLQQLDSAQKTKIDLVTGQVLSGEVLELNERHLILNAWYSRNSLRIPRDNIMAIRPASEETSLIYEGPTGMEEWKIKSGKTGNGLQDRVVPQQLFKGGVPFPVRPRIPGKVGGGIGLSGWKYNDKAFHGSSSGSLIGRKFDLGESVNLEFNLGWQGNFNLGVGLFADQLDAYSGNSYMVGISSSSCYLTRMVDSVQNNLGQQSFQDLRGKSKARISVRINKSDSSMAVIINDRVIKQWEDNAGFAGKGENLMFVLLQNSNLKVSNIRVTRWDGKLPSASNDDEKEDKDILTTSNSTNLSGKLLGVREGKVIFKASFAPTPLEITMDTVTKIQLAGAKLVKPQLGLGDVRVTFTGGGQFTFLLEKWGADRVSGLSSVLGRLEFQPSAFSVLEFNLTKKEGEGTGDGFEDFE